MQNFPKEIQQFIRHNKEDIDFEEKFFEFSKNYFFLSIKEGIVTNKDKIRKIVVHNPDTAILIFRSFFKSTYPDILCDCAKAIPGYAIRYLSDFLKEYNYEVFEYCVMQSPKEALHFLPELKQDKNLFTICCFLEPEFAVTKLHDTIKKVSGKLLRDLSYFVPKFVLHNLPIRAYLSNYFPEDVEQLKILEKEI